MEKKVKNLNSSSYIRMMPQTTAVNISLFFKTHGRLVTTSTACTSGSMGIGAAYELIRDGRQTVMIAGGAEEFHITQVGVFDTLYATSVKNDTPAITPSPFDKDRDGLVIGEGAGTLILEEYEHAKNRGAKIYAEVIRILTVHTNSIRKELDNLINAEKLVAQIDLIFAKARYAVKTEAVEPTINNKKFIKIVDYRQWRERI